MSFRSLSILAIIAVVTVGGFFSAGSFRASPAATVEQNPAVRSASEVRWRTCQPHHWRHCMLARR